MPGGAIGGVTDDTSNIQQEATLTEKPATNEFPSELDRSFEFIPSDSLNSSQTLAKASSKDLKSDLEQPPHIVEKTPKKPKAVIRVFMHGTGSSEKNLNNPAKYPKGELISRLAEFSRQQAKTQENNGGVPVHVIELNGPGSGNTDAQRRKIDSLPKWVPQLLQKGAGYGAYWNVIEALYQIHELVEEYEDIEIEAYGWSRGAIICILLTYALSRQMDLKDFPVRLFLTDPVRGFAFELFNWFFHALSFTSNVKETITFIAQHERSYGFTPFVGGNVQLVPGNHSTVVGGKSDDNLSQVSDIIYAQAMAWMANNKNIPMAEENFPSRDELLALFNQAKKDLEDGKYAKLSDAPWYFFSRKYYLGIPQFVSGPRKFTTGNDKIRHAYLDESEELAKDLKCQEEGYVNRLHKYLVQNPNKNLTDYLNEFYGVEATNKLTNKLKDVAPVPAPQETVETPKTWEQHPEFKRTQLEIQIKLIMGELALLRDRPELPEELATMIETAINAAFTLIVAATGTDSEKLFETVETIYTLLEEAKLTAEEVIKKLSGDQSQVAEEKNDSDDRAATTSSDKAILPENSPKQEIKNTSPSSSPSVGVHEDTNSKKDVKLNTSKEPTSPQIVNNSIASTKVEMPASQKTISSPVITTPKSNATVNVSTPSISSKETIKATVKTPEVTNVSSDTLSRSSSTNSVNSVASHEDTGVKQKQVPKETVKCPEETTSPTVVATVSAPIPPIKSNANVELPSSSIEQTNNANTTNVASDHTTIAEEKAEIKTVKEESVPEQVVVVITTPVSNQTTNEPSAKIENVNVIEEQVIIKQFEDKEEKAKKEKAAQEELDRLSELLLLDNFEEEHEKKLARSESNSSIASESSVEHEAPTAEPTEDPAPKVDAEFLKDAMVNAANLANSPIPLPQAYKQLNQDIEVLSEWVRTQYYNNGSDVPSQSASDNNNPPGFEEVQRDFWRRMIQAVLDFLTRIRDSVAAGYRNMKEGAQRFFGGPAAPTLFAQQAARPVVNENPAMDIQLPQQILAF